MAVGVSFSEFARKLQSENHPPPPEISFAFFITIEKNFPARLSFENTNSMKERGGLCFG